MGFFGLVPGSKGIQTVGMVLIGMVIIVVMYGFYTILSSIATDVFGIESTDTKIERLKNNERTMEQQQKALLKANKIDKEISKVEKKVVKQQNKHVDKIDKKIRLIKKNLKTSDAFYSKKISVNKQPTETTYKLNKTTYKEFGKENINGIYRVFNEVEGINR